MILLDAYALVAFLANEPAADDVEALLRGGHTGVPVVSLAEAVDVIQRVHGFDADEIRAALEPLLDEAIAVVGHAERDAWRAAEIRTRHYDRSRRPLSLADCFLLAAAGPDDEIATSDGAMAEVARAEGVSVLALPDSTGERP